MMLPVPPLLLSNSLHYSITPCIACFSLLDGRCFLVFYGYPSIPLMRNKMTRDKKRISLHSKKIANDNRADPDEKIEIRCLFPEHLGILSGEVDLVARYLGHILLGIANDNNSDSDTNPGK